ncbi:hypothetical protein Tcan_18627 [Toxocara canis]|uniref:Uncharacterized protein n=1 Tax=Toxocara canis TaxID=6265 RepID=A0A0B2W6H4_TOXCA|nr:hypothetical protein Tcan_18627 [Toxocara canis]
MHAHLLQRLRIKESAHKINEHQLIIRVLDLYTVEKRALALGSPCPFSQRKNPPLLISNKHSKLQTTQKRKPQPYAASAPTHRPLAPFNVLLISLTAPVMGSKDVSREGRDFGGRHGGGRGFRGG